MTEVALDPYVILAALGLRAAATATPVAGGTATAIWRVTYGRGVYALRLFRANQTEICQREVVAMRLARQAGLPVPPVELIGCWHDRPVLLLGWRPGVPLLHTLTRQPWRIGLIGQAFGRTQARLHAVRCAPNPVLPSDTWINWQGMYDTALQQRLRSVAGNADRLLHLDFHPLNVLADGRTITAVIDWTNVHIGDPRADVARTYTIMAIDPAWPRQPHITLLRWLFIRAWQRGYAQEAGPLSDMALFYTWAGAVMQRDLAARLTAAQLALVRRWTEMWRQRAGLTTH